MHDNKFSLGIDYLQGTFSYQTYDDFLELVEMVEMLTNDKFALESGKQMNRGKNWSNSGKSAGGSFIAWNYYQEPNNTRGEGWLSIPGKVCSSLEVYDIWRLCGRLRKYSFKCSRVDIRLDDHTWEFLNRENVSQAWELKNFAGVASRECHIKNEDEWTYYFGSMRSNKYCRIYNKTAESKGKVDACRLEMVFKDKFSRNWYETFTLGISGRMDSFLDETYDIFYDVLFGEIQYVDRNVTEIYETHVDRCPELSWFTDLKAALNAEPIKKRFRPQPVKPSLELTFDWIKDKVSSSIAIIRMFLGFEQFHQLAMDLADLGDLKITKKHQAMLQDAINKKIKLSFKNAVC